MPDNTAAIAEIEETLNSGVVETQVGATKTKVDIASLQRRLAYLKATDDTGNQVAKSKFVQVDLG